MHPLDKASVALAQSLAPIDCDGHTLGRGIALAALAVAALVSRYTDTLEPVAEGLTETEEARAADDVTILLDIAHRYSMEAGPRDLTDGELGQMWDTLERLEGDDGETKD